MKSDQEFAFDFVERLINGDIESNFPCLVQIFGASHHIVMKSQLSMEELSKVANSFRQHHDPSDKETVEREAKEIVNLVFDLRLARVFLDNPNRAKHIADERDFYKAQLVLANQIIEEQKRAIEQLKQEKKQTELPPERNGMTAYRG